jgi:hypothetical protein
MADGAGHAIRTGITWPGAAGYGEATAAVAAVAFSWATFPRTAVSPPRWSSGTARAHAAGMSVLTPAEIMIATRRLAGARPHLAAVAGIVHHDDLWRRCRDELTGVDVRIDGWDIRGRWFGVVAGATPRLGKLPRRETIPWWVIATQMAPREHRGLR